MFEPLENRQLMSAGSLDTSFGQGGKTQPFQFEIADVAVQADGKSVYVGMLNNQFAVGRLDASGQIDTHFGANGIAKTNFGTQQSIPQRVVIQPDGKILVGGLIYENADGYRWGLARYMPNGSLDSSYGNGGIETVLGTQTTDGIAALTLQSDGKILFAADRNHGQFFGLGDGYNIAIVRLQPNGALDGNFGDNNDDGGTPRKGYVDTDFNSVNDVPVSLAVTKDGRIVVGGNQQDIVNPVWVIGRYTRDGRLDSSFDGDGKVITHFADRQGEDLRTIAVDTNGQIYAGGGILKANGNARDQMLVMRYNLNGQVDTSFGNNGQVLLHPGTGTDTSGDVADQIILPAPGKALVVGRQNYMGPILALQLKNNGALDPTFGTNGVATFDTATLISPVRAAVTPDGKVVVAASRALLNIPGVPEVNCPIIRFVEEVPQVTITTAVANALEGGHDGSVLFSRDAAYNFNTRVFFTTAGTATANVDYTGQLAPVGTTIIVKGKPITITSLFKYIDIPAGQQSTRVMVHAVDDTITEPIETVTVTATADPSFKLGSQSTATVSIIDNDAPIIIHPLSTTTATKSLAAATFGNTAITAGTSAADTDLVLASASH
jgi:uncharacterized delta-60 repeat protein